MKEYAAFLLIISLVVPTAEAICPLEVKRSKTWFGVCAKSKSCDNQCRTWERAKHGACNATWRHVLGVREGPFRDCMLLLLL
ncbi:unnamed protein product [Prunus armeniaca]|uniref:Knottins-like domain-containing protein n=1 Tax=Prunus armeniaca TaxID=36596 RepID=A0A6J5Y6R2_PRUAR|nr:unnamed protein product [Prunus armeniaca]